MATIWTALGAMFIPLAFVLYIGVPEAEKWIVYTLLITGFFSLLMGLFYTVKEEQQRRKEMRLFALMIAGIAEKMGVDMSETAKLLQGGKYGKPKQ